MIILRLKAFSKNKKKGHRQRPTQSFEEAARELENNEHKQRQDRPKDNRQHDKQDSKKPDNRNQNPKQENHRKPENNGQQGRGNQQRPRNDNRGDGRGKGKQFGDKAKNAVKENEAKGKEISEGFIKQVWNSGPLGKAAVIGIPTLAATGASIYAAKRIHDENKINY